MLKIIHALRELQFGQLMDVYTQSNAEFYGGNVLQAEQEFYAYLRECFFTDPMAFYAVWVCDGRYKAALRVEPYNDGLLLAALETAPAERKKGYATELVRDVLELLAAQGNTAVYSHVHKKNVASLAVHRACGFEKILDYARYADGSIMKESYTLCKHLNKK